MERDPQREALAETRARIAAMESLLEDLPAIFEAKFRQRLQPLLDHQQRLLHENADLRQQLLLLQGVEQSERRPHLLPLPGRQRRFRSDDDEPPIAGSAGPTHR